MRLNGDSFVRQRCRLHQPSHHAVSKWFQHLILNCHCCDWYHSLHSRPIWARKLKRRENKEVTKRKISEWKRTEKKKNQIETKMDGQKSFCVATCVFPLKINTTRKNSDGHCNCRTNKNQSGKDDEWIQWEPSYRLSDLLFFSILFPFFLFSFASRIVNSTLKLVSVIQCSFLSVTWMKSSFHPHTQFQNGQAAIKTQNNHFRKVKRNWW